MSAPTPVYSNAFFRASTSGTTLSSTSISCNAGDVLVVHGLSEDASTTLAISGGTGLTWTLQQSSLVSSNVGLYTWTTTVGSAQSVTVTLTGNKNTLWSMYVDQWRTATVGASAKANGSSTTASVAIATTGGNSAISAVMGDWNAVACSSDAWTTSIGTPNTLLKLTDTTQNQTTAGSNYMTSGAVYGDTGTAGTKTVSMTNSASMKWTIHAIEIKGASPATVNGSATLTSSSTLTASTPTTQNAAATLSTASSLTATPQSSSAVVHRTSWYMTSQASSYTLTLVDDTTGLPYTPAAGNLLVMVSAGPAVTTVSGFTKRSPTSLNNFEVAVQDKVAAGTESALSITYNGPTTMSGVLYELVPGFSYVNGVHIDTSAGVYVSHGSLNCGTDPAVVFQAVVGDTTYLAPLDPRGIEPAGRKQYGTNFLNGTERIGSLFTASDVDANTTVNPGMTVSIADYYQNTDILGTNSQALAVAYANTSGSPVAKPFANRIEKENARPARYKDDWFLNTLSTTISGFTDKVSYLPGDTINFKVDSGNAAFTVEVLRLGHYSFMGARRVAAPFSGTPAAQPAPVTDTTLRNVTCAAWSTTATWTVPSDATPGVYQALFRGNGGFSVHTFVVRDPDTVTGKVVFKTSDATWAAYNSFATTASQNGGPSLYHGAGDNVIGNRAYAATYDRPQGYPSGDTYFFNQEFPLLAWLERNAYDLTYRTDWDLDGDATGAWLKQQKALFIQGHDEYWTINRRAAVDAARAAGVHLLILSGNTMLWRCRVSASDTNRRTIICYKDSAESSQIDPVTWTGTWRDSRWSGRDPESRSTGLWFIANGTRDDNMLVPSTYASSPFWRNTSVSALGSSWAETTASNLYRDGMPVQGPVEKDNTGTTIHVANGFVPKVNCNVIALRYYRVAGASEARTGHLFNAAGTNLATVTFATGTTAGWVSATLSTPVALTAGSTYYVSVENPNGNYAVYSSNYFSFNSVLANAPTDHGTVDLIGASRGAGGSGGSLPATGSTALYAVDAVFDVAPQRSTPTRVIASGLVGFEWDYVKTSETTTPTNMVALSDSGAITMTGVAPSDNGYPYTSTVTANHQMVLWADPSGALIFNTGIDRYGMALDIWDQGGPGLAAFTAFAGFGQDRDLAQALYNVMLDMGVTPSALDPSTGIITGSAQPASAYGLTGGGATQSGSATLSGSSSLTANATTVGTVNGSATLSSACSLTAQPLVTVAASSALQTGSSLAGTAKLTVLGAATLPSSSSLTSTATLTRTGSASLTTGSALSAAGSTTVIASATLTSASALTASGTIARPGNAFLSTTSTLTASPVVTESASASLGSSSTLTAAATTQSSGAVSLGSNSSLTSSATITAQGSATLPTGSALTASGGSIQSAAAALTSASSLLAAGSSAAQSLVALPSTSSLQASVTVTSSAVLNLSTSSTLTIALTGQVEAACSLASSSTLVSQASVTVPTQILLGTGSSVTVDGVVVVLPDANLRTQSSLTVSGAASVDATASLVGSSSLNIEIAGSSVAVATLVSGSTLQTSADVLVTGRTTLAVDRLRSAEYLISYQARDAIENRNTEWHPF